MKIEKEALLGTIGILGLCIGSALVLLFFPLEQFVMPGYRDLADYENTELWIIGCVLFLIGTLIFRYLWRDIISFKPDKDAKRKRRWHL
jgi:membrane protein implicated in regulation of membrane protease activity